MIASELQRLLQACKDEPDDDGPRLILSDWLEEHGQGDRAEFVRLQLRLAGQQVPAGDEAVAAARAHQLYLRHADEWLGALRHWAGRCTFRGGFIEVTARVEALRDQPPHIVAPQAAPWLESLLVEYGRQQAIDDLLAADALACFSSLDVTDVQLAPRWVARLANSPNVAHLRRLRLLLDDSPKAAVESLARSPFLTQLRILDMAEAMGDNSLEVLAGAPILRNLTTLPIRFRRVNRGLAALARAVPPLRLRRLLWRYVTPGVALGELARSAALADLVELQIEEFFSAGDIEALATRRDWPRLQRLSLGYTSLGEESIRALVRMTGFRCLRSLNLNRTGLTAPLLAQLLSAPWLGGLERLDLTNTYLEDAGAIALANCPALANLRHLELGRTGIGPDGVRALANSPHLGKLETLNLAHIKSGDLGLAALADATGLPALTALSLRMVGATGQGLTQVVRSPLAERLRRLDLSENHLDGKAGQLLGSSRLGNLKDLRLDWNRLGKAGAEALAAGPFKGLVRLSLVQCALKSSSVRALLATHGFPQLSILHLRGAELGEQGKEALLRWPRLRQLASLYCDHRQGDPPEFLALAQSVTFCEAS